MIGISLGIGQMSSPDEDSSPPVTQLRINELGDGALEIEAGEDVLNITISDTTSFNGTYQVDPNELAAGPVNLIPPVLAATDVTVGDDIEITPGFWVFDAGQGKPLAGYAHNGSGAISDEIYTTQLADGGQDIIVSETAVQPNGQRTAVSNAIAVKAISTFEPPALGNKLSHWWDATDPSTIWTDTGGTIQAVSVGDTVMRIDDKSSNVQPLQAGGSFAPGNGLRTQDGVDWNGAKFMIDGISEPTADMELYAVIENEDPEPFIFANTESDAGRFLGVAQSGSGSATDAGYTDLIYSTDGVENTFGTRESLYSAWGTGQRVISAHNIDWSGARSENLIILGYRNSGTFRFFGTTRHIVVTQALTNEERADLTAWLLTEAAQ